LIKKNWSKVCTSPAPSGCPVAIDQAAQEIESQLYALGKSEIDSLQIGEMVMDHLQDIDDVAYVRFASVYRRFRDVDSIAEEIQHLQARKRREVANQIPLPIGGIKNK
jgi:transcriptional repressor NrdR